MLEASDQPAGRTGSIRLRSTDFRREREQQWTELERLVQQAERRGLRSLSTEELHRLPSLYFVGVSSLSVARAISLDANLLGYLESLVARAYFAVYGVKPRPWDQIRRFFGYGFPVVFRRHAGRLLLAAAVLVAGLVLGMSVDDPSTYEAIMPASLAGGRSHTSSTEELRGVLVSGGDERSSRLALFASLLFSNNAKVGILSFVLGFALGIPTLILLFYNGLVLGTLAGLYHLRGLGTEFWAWVLPHGVSELLAVVVCGAAGLMVALALVRGGPYGRIHALMEVGREAAVLVLGACLMFVFAAVIEGVFRQLVVDVPIRLAMVVSTSLFWVTYLGFVGRRRSA